ncbi:ATP-binding protein [Embleya sp. AB8]|uniref:ATP-binding protein n=1 Tax=Embleya sp. AB8 TaxID=3156304 RepID=UPI003C77A743
MPSDASVCLVRPTLYAWTACLLNLAPGEYRPVERARACALVACRNWRVDGGDLVLVIAELLTNAFEHAGLVGEQRVLVRICWRRHLAELELEVVVPQTGFVLPEFGDVDPDAESGRGLVIVRNLVRTFSCEERTPGQQVFRAVLDAA